MKVLRQFGVVLCIGFMGQFLCRTLKLPVPGNVLGMIILLILLSLKVITVEMIKDISDFMLDHLPFFFIPAGVGLISSFELLKGKWLAIILICVIPTILGIVATGLTIQSVKRRLKI